MPAQLMELQLVYPPVSNWEFDHLSEDQEVAESVKHSHLYMICQRPVLKFYEPGCDFSDPHASRFAILKSGSDEYFTIVIDIFQIVNKIDAEFDEEVILEMGERMVQIKSLSGEIIYWCTPDKLAYDLTKFSNCGNSSYIRELLTYELLYVGISKQRDSLSRLSKEHQGRLKILSQEKSITPGDSLSDGMIILLFDVKSIRINVVDDPKNFNFEANYESLEKIRIISDVEKIFIKLLDPKYNMQKYSGYPQSKDGLFNLDIDGAMYVLSEMIELKVGGLTFSGNSNFQFSDSLSADFAIGDVNIFDFKGQPKFVPFNNLPPSP